MELTKVTRYFLVVVGIVLIVAFHQGCSSTKQQEVRLPTNTYINPDDIKFGQQQVDQMIHDRPEMATCVTKSDIIYVWAARQFAGEGVGQRIYWSAAPPDCAECLASSTTPYGSRKGFIHIREQYAAGSQQGQKVPCEELWSLAIFELYNIANAPELTTTQEAAGAGKLSRQEYITSISKLEFLALHKRAQFYRTVWRPWADNKQMATHKWYWDVNVPSTYEEWMKRYTDPSGYPYDVYGKGYDDTVAPYLKR